MTVLSGLHLTAKSSVVEATHLLRRFRSLASMLPSLLLTGVVTLVMTAVMRLMWMGFSSDFFRVWIESWLIAWPITFPVAYMAGPLVVRLAARMTLPAAKTAAFEPVGLAFSDIEDVSARATAKNGFKVQRRLKRDFNA
jgi:hypothetical protein